MGLAAVAVGGLAGAVARYLVGTVAPSTLAHTLAVNLAGSLALGAVVALGLGDPPALALGVGFCGAFTTFSSFAVEVVRLAENGRSRRALAYAGSMLVGGTLAVLTGGLFGAAI